MDKAKQKEGDSILSENNQKFRKEQESDSTIKTNKVCGRT